MPLPIPEQTGQQFPSPSALNDVAHTLLRTASAKGIRSRLCLSRDKAARPGCPSSTLMPTQYYKLISPTRLT